VGREKEYGAEGSGQEEGVLVNITVLIVSFASVGLNKTLMVRSRCNIKLLILVYASIKSSTCNISCP
jgi:hypothetical protein